MANIIKKIFGKFAKRKVPKKEISKEEISEIQAKNKTGQTTNTIDVIEIKTGDKVSYVGYNVGDTVEQESQASAILDELRNQSDVGEQIEVIAAKDPDVQEASNLGIPVGRYRQYREWYDEHQRLMQQYGIESKEASAYFASFFRQIKYQAFIPKRNTSTCTLLFGRSRDG